MAELLEVEGESEDIFEVEDEDEGADEKVDRGNAYDEERVAPRYPWRPFIDVGVGVSHVIRLSNNLSFLCFRAAPGFFSYSIVQLFSCSPDSFDLGNQYS